MEQEKDIEVCDQDEKDSVEAEVIETEVVDEGETVVIDEQENNTEVELNKLTTENEQLKDRMLRVQAEFENYKRRTDKEKVAARIYKAQDLATELLPVMDNFERALQTEITEENQGFFEGVQMVYRQLKNALDSEEVKAIETVNQPFDPNLHDAVMQVEDENIEPNIIVEELQKGYMLKDKVIRPAMVKVNK
jgi:molecular chaperone GrpE